MKKAIDEAAREIVQEIRTVCGDAYTYRLEDLISGTIRRRLGEVVSYEKGKK